MTKDASDTLRVTPLPFMVPRSNICLFPRTPTSSYGTLDPTIARTCGSSREERHRLQERNIVWRKLDERGAQFLLNQTTCTDELSGGARIADATPPRFLSPTAAWGTTVATSCMGRSSARSPPPRSAGGVWEAGGVPIQIGRAHV